MRERGDDNSVQPERWRRACPARPRRFDNATDAHAVYIDDRIAYGNWRVTPGVRFEHIETEPREQRGTATRSSSIEQQGAAVGERLRTW